MGIHPINLSELTGFYGKFMDVSGILIKPHKFAANDAHVSCGEGGNNSMGCLSPLHRSVHSIPINA